LLGYIAKSYSFGWKATSGTGLGNYSVSLSVLNPNTVYYYRAYAVNNIGVAYGAEYNFSTQSSGNLPAVTTTAASNITGTSAVSGGMLPVMEVQT